MKPPPLNKLHRYVGISIAPFLVIQALSGLLLDFGLFRRDHPTVEDAAAARSGLDRFLVTTHFGHGLVNDTYHILLGIGIFWMAWSGWLLYLRMRRARGQAGRGKP